MAFNSALWEEKTKQRAVRVQQRLQQEAITQKMRSEAVSAGMHQGMSWEDISKKTKIPLSFVQSYSQQVNPNYGIKPTDTRSNIQKAGGLAKGLGEAFASSYNRVGSGVAEVLGSDAQARANQAVAQADTASTDLIRKAGQRLQDPTVPEAQKARIQDLINKVAGQTEKSFAANNAINKQIQERTDPVKGAAAVANIGLDVLTGGTIGNAATTGARGLAREAATGAFQGALGGGIGAVEQSGKNVNLKQVAQGAGIGAGLGGGLTLASGLAGDAISKKLTDLKKPTSVSAPVTKQDLNTTIHLPDKGVYAKVTPEQAAILRNEVKNVKSNTGDIVYLSANTPALQRGAKEVPLSEIANLSPNAKSSLSALEVNKPTLTQAVDNTGVSGVAKTTEARTIENKLSTGFADLPTYEKVNLADQANKTVDLINTDYNIAKEIALGNRKAPEGLLPTSVYKGVETQAIKEGDVETLRQLATQSKIVGQSTKAGQFNAALAQKDPESPLTVMQKVIKAREDSKLPNVPKDLAPEEAQIITDLSKQVADAKLALENGGDRLAYGKARVALDNYASDLQLAASKKGFKEKLLQHPGDTLTDLAGASKGIKAAFDNSALFRQGWKTLFTNPVKWQKNARQSFVDIFKQFGGKPVMDELKADIISRPNSVNGLYKKMQLDVMDIAEEAFPNTLPEKIPGIGRLYKASEAAYTGFIQRQRADIADKMLEVADKVGVDLSSKKELESIGKMVNSLTGRGDLGPVGEKSAKVLNNFFFSPRNLKSNIDMLTAHQLQRGVTPFVRKEAAKNLVKVIGGTAAVLATANALKPGSVEWDPRSSNFGKIKIGNTRFEVSGGMASIITLASRLATDSTKSSSTGRVTKLNSGEFGGRTSWNVIQDFIDGKLSPLASTFKQWKTGTDFQGNKTTPAGLAKNLIVPLPVTNYQELKNDPKSANDLASMIADSLGIGTNTYSGQKDWTQSNTKKITGFKQKVDEKTFVKANNDFNEAYTSWLDKATNSDKFKKLPAETQKTLLSQKTQDLTDEILKKYGYEYKTQKKSSEDKQTIKDLKGL